MNALSLSLARMTTPHVASVLLVILVVVVSLISRIPKLGRRPIQTDELITLQNYTWAGVYSDGTRRELRRQADVDNLEDVSLRRTVIGSYCSFGRWPEPNNHVFHSALTNIALFAPCSTLTAIRLPPLLCCGVFALLSAWLCLRCNLTVAAPSVALFAMWSPYCVYYSQESRGYALMLALCVGLVLLLQQNSVRINSLVWSISVVAIACATFENIVNLSLDWVVPVLMGSMCAPVSVLGKNLDQKGLSEWRRSILCQLIVVSAIGFTFLMDRLPYVYSSAQQYGIPLLGIEDLWTFVDESIKLFAPSACWLAVTVCGLLGAVIALRKRDTRCLVVPWIIAGVVSVIHFAATKKLPYVRNMGHLLPLIMFGYGCTIESVIGLSTGRVAKLALAIAVTAFSTMAIMSSANVDYVDRDYVALADKLVASDSESSHNSLLLLGDGVANTISLSVPVQDDVAISSQSSEEIQVMVIEKTAFPFRLVGEVHTLEVPFSERWKSQRIDDVGPYRIHRLSCTKGDQSDLDGHSPSLCVWSPKFESVNVTDRFVLNALEEARLPYRPLYERYQAKMEVFSCLKRIVVDVSDTENDFTAGNHAIDRLKLIIDRFGGQSVILVPKYK